MSVAFGVAVVVVPGEIFLAPAVESGWLTKPILPTRSVVRPDDEGLRRAADILNAGERVTILGGAGVEGAHDDLVDMFTLAVNGTRGQRAGRVSVPQGRVPAPGPLAEIAQW